MLEHEAAAPISVRTQPTSSLLLAIGVGTGVYFLLGLIEAVLHCLATAEKASRWPISVWAALYLGSSSFMYLWYVVSFLPPPPPVDLVALLTLTAFLTGELLVPLGEVEPPIMVMENGE